MPAETLCGKVWGIMVKRSCLSTGYEIVVRSVVGPPAKCSLSRSVEVQHAAFIGVNACAHFCESAIEA